MHGVSVSVPGLALKCPKAVKSGLETSLGGTGMAPHLAADVIRTRVVEASLDDVVTRDRLADMLPK